jgi:GTP cyclohydrolase II
MPDIFHWLGITKIDRFASMSNMKFDALAKHGINIIERVPIPPELIPADAAVEMEAKKAAGYFVPDPEQVADADELKNIQGRKLDE